MKYVIGALSFLLIILLIGSATAETIIGDASGESHERIERLPNSVLIEKFVHHELKNGAKITDSASGPLSATNTDPANADIEVDLDAYKLDVSGKVSGTGTAVLDAHVLAEGSIDPTTGEVVVSTDIASSVDLESGAKGKAEGKASASGEGSADLYYYGTFLSTVVDGSTAASGKVSSGSVGTLLAEGSIEADAFADLPNGIMDADAEIFSEVGGENNAEGSASADGSADAFISVYDVDRNIDWHLDAFADAATTASGKGSGPGEFEVEAEAESHSNVALPKGADPIFSVYSEVEADAWSAGAKGYSATTSAVSETGMFAGNFATISVMDFNADPIVIIPLTDISTSGTATAGTSQKGAGEVEAESEIEAEYRTPGELDWENLLVLDDIAGIGFSEVPALESGYSAIWSDVWVDGSGSAVATADGEAEQFGQATVSTGNTVRTSAEGETGASARTTGTGSADAWATIDSDGLTLLDGGEFVYFFDLSLPKTSIDIPEIPEIPDTPQIDDLLRNEKLFGDGMQLPTDSVGLLQNNEEFRIPTNLDELRGVIPNEIALPDDLSGEGGIDLPPILTTSLSIIESGASASGNAKKDSASASSFVKKGETEGYSAMRGQGLASQSLTSSEGSTATSASANEVTDPASEAVITSISLQGIGGVEVLDASLIGSASFADGIKGTTSGMAEGRTSVGGGFMASGSTSATGVAHTTATANGGVSVAAAGLGSANFEVLPPLADDLAGTDIDISMLGSAAGTIGTGSAAADASGTTQASGFIFDFDGTDELVIRSLTNVTGTSSVSTGAKNGIAAAVDGLVAGELVNADNIGVASGDIIGGSLVGELVFAERFGENGFAKAAASASGTARTNGTFKVANDDITGASRFIEGKAVTQAKGSVKGTANEITADPLSASVILAFTDVNGDDGDDLTTVDGDVHGAGLIGSVSVASGNSGSTTGSADGAATVTAGLKINGTVETVDEESQDQALGVLVVADGAVATSAAAKGGLAASAAVEAASASVEYDPTIEVGFNADLSDISLLLAGSTAFGTSSSTASASADEIEADSSLGIFAWEVDDPVDYHTEGLVAAGAGLLKGATASSSATANNGFAVGLSGIGSGVFTDFTSFEEEDTFPASWPEADITSVSLLISGAAGVSDSTTGMAKAVTSASGDTGAGVFAADELSAVTLGTYAEGTTNAIAETKAKSDPVSIAAILSFSDFETDINDDTGQYETGLDETTLIASGSFTAGDRSTTSGSADGFADADGDWLLKTDADLEPFGGATSHSDTTADVTSSASANKGGIGLSAAGVGSESTAFLAGIDSYVDDENLEFAYAGGEGFTKSSSVTAASGFEDAESNAGSKIFFTDPEDPWLSSTSDVSGDGTANVKVNGENMAKALAFGRAAQFAGTSPLANDYSIADVAFGTEAMGTDNAPVEAHARMEDIGLHAVAATNGMFFSPPTFVDVGYEDGVSYIDLLPKKNLLNWDTYAIGDPNPQVNIGGAALTEEDKAYNLNTGVLDPNYAVWTKFAGGMSSPPLPPAPDFFVLPDLPPPF